MKNNLAGLFAAGLLCVGIITQVVHAQERKPVRILLASALEDCPMNPPAVFWQLELSGDHKIVEVVEAGNSLGRLDFYPEQKKALLWMHDKGGAGHLTVIDFNASSEPEMPSAKKYAIPYSPVFAGHLGEDENGIFYISRSTGEYDYNIFTCRGNESEFVFSGNNVEWHNIVKNATARRSDPLHMVYNAETDAIAVRFGPKLVPFGSFVIPEDLRDSIKLIPLDDPKSLGGSLIANTGKYMYFSARGMNLDSPTRWIFDKAAKVWHMPGKVSGNFPGNLCRLVLGDDLMAHQYLTQGSAPYEFAPTGEYTFFSVPSLDILFDVLIDSEAIILHLDGERIIYRIGHAIWIGEIERLGIQNIRKLAENEMFEHAHWAMPIDADFTASPIRTKIVTLRDGTRYMDLDDFGHARNAVEELFAIPFPGEVIETDAPAIAPSWPPPGGELQGWRRRPLESRQPGNADPPWLFFENRSMKCGLSAMAKPLRAALALTCLAVLAHGQESSGRAAYILVNGQEFDKWEAPLPAYPVPVLFFKLEAGLRQESDFGLLAAYDVIGHRRIQLLPEKRALVVWKDGINEAIVADLAHLADLSESPSFCVPYDSSYVVWNMESDEPFFVSNALDIGEYSTKFHFRASGEGHALDAAPFKWDNALISSQPRHAKNKGPSFRIVYDGTRHDLARHAGFTLFPLAEIYPDEVKYDLSKIADSGLRHNYVAALSRNDARQRILIHTPPGPANRKIYAYDFIEKKWNAVLIPANTVVSNSGSWLCMSEYDPDKSEPGLPPAYTGENIFYHLPELNGNFRWKSNPDWEVLTIDDGYMLYRMDDEIWGAEISHAGIRENRLLAKSEYIRGIHWALRLDSEEHFNKPTEWPDENKAPVALFPASWKGYYIKSACTAVARASPDTASDSSQKGIMSTDAKAAFHSRARRGIDADARPPGATASTEE